MWRCALVRRVFVICTFLLEVVCLSVLLTIYPNKQGTASAVTSLSIQ